MEPDITQDIEHRLERRLDAAVLRYKLDQLFERYGLPVVPVPFEYTGEQWQQLALALALKHERKIMAEPKTRLGRKPKWTQNRLFHLLACVEAVKRERGVSTGKEAIRILTTELPDGLGPQNRKDWTPKGGSPATKAEALKLWQRNLEGRLSDAQEEYRKWKKRPRGLLHTLGFPGLED